MKIKPTPQQIAKHAIECIIIAMLKQDDEILLSAESHLAEAVLVLNQLAELSGFDDTDMNEQLIHCRDIALTFKRSLTDK